MSGKITRRDAIGLTAIGRGAWRGWNDRADSPGNLGPNQGRRHHVGEAGRCRRIWLPRGTATAFSQTLTELSPATMPRRRIGI